MRAVLAPVTWLALGLTMGLSACGSEPEGPTQADLRAQAEAARLASEIDAAVDTVTGVLPGSPPLFEGTPLASFTPAQIQAYCGMPWETRISASGRTEYNPCRRRDAFSTRPER